MRKFYRLMKGQSAGPEFYFPVYDAEKNPIPLLHPAIEKQVGDRLEAVLAAVDGLKVCNALSVLDVAKEAVMQCPVCSKDTGGPNS